MISGEGPYGDHADYLGGRKRRTMRGGIKWLVA